MLSRTAAEPMRCQRWTDRSLGITTWGESVLVDQIEDGLTDHLSVIRTPVAGGSSQWCDWEAIPAVQGIRHFTPRTGLKLSPQATGPLEIDLLWRLAGLISILRGRVAAEIDTWLVTSKSQRPAKKG